MTRALYIGVPEDEKLLPQIEDFTSKRAKLFEDNHFLTQYLNFFKLKQNILYY